MELKEYVKIFKKNLNWFLSVLGIVLFGGLLIQLILGGWYKVELDLNITRTGYQADTSEYRYDEFYRLQADERFSDTVVQWTNSRRIKEDISNKAKGINFVKFKAERLSSQMIKVSFLIKDKNQASKITQSITEVLNDKTDELNLEQKNPSWFKILVSSPVTYEYRISFGKLVMMLLFGGVFLGFWVVLIKHYME